MIYIAGFAAGLLLGYIFRDGIDYIRESWEEVRRDGFNG